MNYDLEAARLKKDWAENPRWKGVERGYSAEDVVGLRRALHIEHTRARRCAEKLWKLISDEPFVNTLGALTGNQALQQVKAGLKAIYLSGWQVAADANIAGEMYPDQSRYPANSVPAVVRRINNTFVRADQIAHAEGKDEIDYFAPIVADAEAGFGGVLNAFELMKSMIEAGASGVHFEDQLASVKKCGHMGGKVLRAHARSGREADCRASCRRLPRCADDLLARTDAGSGRSRHVRHRRQRQAVSAPPSARSKVSTRRATASTRRSHAVSRTRYADLIWCETGKPDLAFREGAPMRSMRSFRTRCWRTTVRRRSTGRRISTTRRSRVSSASSARWATSSSSSRSPASTASTSRCSTSPHGMRSNMAAFVELQEAEFAAVDQGFTAVKHQREVGTGYFDAVTQTVQGSQSSTTALKGSTEDEQFFDDAKKLHVANG
jgi:isocitrate lyase